MKIFHNASFVYHVLKKVTEYENDRELPKSLIDTKALVWIFSVSRTLSLPLSDSQNCYCYSLPLEIPACAIKEPAMVAIRSEMNRWFVGHCGKDGDRTDRDIITTKLFLVNIWFGAAKKQHNGLRAHTICSQKKKKKCCKSSCKKAKWQLREQFQLC